MCAHPAFKPAGPLRGAPGALRARCKGAVAVGMYSTANALLGGGRRTPSRKPGGSALGSSELYTYGSEVGEVEVERCTHAHTPLIDI